MNWHSRRRHCLLGLGCAHTERSSTTTDRCVPRPITCSQTAPHVARFPWRTYDARHGRRLSRSDYMGIVAETARMSEPFSLPDHDPPSTGLPIRCSQCRELLVVVFVVLGA